MVFEGKIDKIKQFILGNFKFENIELFMNSFAIYYLKLKEEGKINCEEYLCLDNFFKEINRFPRVRDNEIYWVKNKNIEKNNFFKKKRRNLNEKILIRDIFSIKDWLIFNF